MDRWVKRDSAVALGLVMCGVLARLACRDVPNFAPVAGLALFAGYYLRSWRLAVLVPWAIMLISDQFLGGYDWKLQLVVYSLLALPVFARGMLQRLLNDAPTSTGPANFAAGGASESSTGRNESSVAGASRDVSGRLAAGHWGAVSRSALRSSLVITGASVTGSVVFFLGSNIAVWALASWYPHTWQGLSSCLINALPFFQYTLAGDLFFSWSAFAILAGAQAWSAARSCVTRHSF